MEEVKTIKESCLVRLTTKCWSGVKKLPPNVLEKIGDSNWLRGSKRLVNPDDIAGPRQVISKAMRYIKSKAAEFPIPGMHLISSNLILLVSRDLDVMRDEFKAEVEGVVEAYNAIREHARPFLEEAGLYNDLDYPEDLRRCYNFKWNLIAMDTPNLSRISPELYEQEARKFQETMAEARKLTSDALKIELADLVNHMVERLKDSGKPKKFKNTTVTNFHEFLYWFSDRNLFADAQLAELAEKARLVMEGITPEDLREYTDVQERVRIGMKDLKALVDEAVIDVPRRIITIPGLDQVMDQEAA